ncbi:hypothetical protein BC938DRAFT_481417 [Jimgerdemannia flammicorona]|uniref:BRCT domain-containing protein n=1 Tax=Jimgerdemannia flammicorona TaxID=994334 RepID=A0A433QGA5_9FUNG|nr:hypothetical protein BC938DRAFT_481417 [Jimgerdemannia flammicorona]
MTDSQKRSNAICDPLIRSLLRGGRGEGGGGRGEIATGVDRTADIRPPFPPNATLGLTNTSGDGPSKVHSNGTKSSSDTLTLVTKEMNWSNCPKMVDSPVSEKIVAYPDIQENIAAAPEDNTLPSSQLHNTSAWQNSFPVNDGDPNDTNIVGEFDSYFRRPFPIVVPSTPIAAFTPMNRVNSRPNEPDAILVAQTPSPRPAAQYVQRSPAGDVVLSTLELADVGVLEIAGIGTPAAAASSIRKVTKENVDGSAKQQQMEYCVSQSGEVDVKLEGITQVRDSRLEDSQSKLSQIMTKTSQKTKSYAPTVESRTMQRTLVSALQPKSNIDSQYSTQNGAPDPFHLSGRVPQLIDSEEMWPMAPLVGHPMVAPPSDDEMDMGGDNNHNEFLEKNDGRAGDGGKNDGVRDDERSLKSATTESSDILEETVDREGNGPVEWTHTKTLATIGYTLQSDDEDRIKKPWIDFPLPNLNAKVRGTTTNTTPIKVKASSSLSSVDIETTFHPMDTSHPFPPNDGENAATHDTPIKPAPKSDHVAARRFSPSSSLHFEPPAQLKLAQNVNNAEFGNVALQKPILMSSTTKARTTSWPRYKSVYETSQMMKRREKKTEDEDIEDFMVFGKLLERERERFREETGTNMEVEDDELGRAENNWDQSGVLGKEDIRNGPEYMDLVTPSSSSLAEGSTSQMLLDDEQEVNEDVRFETSVHITSLPTTSTRRLSIPTARDNLLASNNGLSVGNASKGTVTITKAVRKENLKAKNDSNTKSPRMTKIDESKIQQSGDRSHWNEICNSGDDSSEQGSKSMTENNSESKRKIVEVGVEGVNLSHHYQNQESEGYATDNEADIPTTAKPSPSKSASTRTNSSIFIAPQSDRRLEFGSNTRVWAKWSEDRQWYPATIVRRIDYLDKYKVRYDDHDQGMCKTKNLRHLRISVGDTVLAAWTHKYFRQASVIRVLQSDRKFEIRFHDTPKRSIKILDVKNMALSDELVQARDVRVGSMDWNSVTKDKSTLLVSPSISVPKNKGKEKEREVAPAETHSTSLTPSKRKLRSESVSLGIQTEPREIIFAGIGFVITNLNPTLQKQSSCDDAASDTSAFDHQSTVDSIRKGGGIIVDNISDFYRGRLCITPQKTSPSHPGGSRKTTLSVKSVVLVAPTPKRTLKYLMALALGLPRVSIIWIHDCVKQNILLDYNRYLLSNGFSEELSAHIGCFGLRSRLCLGDDPGVFAGLTFHVNGGTNKKFAIETESVIEAAGGAIVSIRRHLIATKTAALSSRTPRHIKCDYVISEKEPTAKFRELIMKRFRRFEVTDIKLEGVQEGPMNCPPVLSMEWVIQCLINQRIVDLNNRKGYTSWVKE